MFSEFLKNALQSEKIEFRQLLQSASDLNITGIIFNLETNTYEVRNQTFTDVIMKDLVFVNNSTYGISAKLAFIDCRFHAVSILQCQLENVSFHTCDFVDCWLDNNEITIYSDVVDVDTDTSWSFVNCTLSNNRIRPDPIVFQSKWKSAELSNTSFVNTTLGGQYQATAWTVEQSNELRLSDSMWVGLHFYYLNFANAKNTLFDSCSWWHGRFKELSNCEFNSTNLYNVSGLGTPVRLVQSSFYKSGWSGSVLGFESNQSQVQQYEFQQLTFSESYLNSIENPEGDLSVTDTTFNQCDLSNVGLNIHRVDNLLFSGTTSKDSQFGFHETNQLIWRDSTLKAGTRIQGDANSSVAHFINSTLEGTDISGFNFTDYQACTFTYGGTYRSSSSVLSNCDLREEMTAREQKTLLFYNAIMINLTANNPIVKLDHCMLQGGSIQHTILTGVILELNNLWFDYSTVSINHGTLTGSELHHTNIDASNSNFSNLVLYSCQLSCESPMFLENCSGIANKLQLYGAHYNGGALQLSTIEAYNQSIVANLILENGIFLHGVSYALLSNLTIEKSLTLVEVDNFQIQSANITAMTKLIVSDIKNTNLVPFLAGWRGGFQIDGDLHQVNLSTLQLPGTLIKAEQNLFSRTCANFKDTNFSNLSIMSPISSSSPYCAWIIVFNDSLQQLQGLDLSGADIRQICYLNQTTTSNDQFYKPCDVDQGFFKRVGIKIDNRTQFRPSDCDVGMIFLLSLSALIVSIIMITGAICSYKKHKARFNKKCDALEGGLQPNLNNLTAGLPDAAQPLMRSNTI